MESFVLILQITEKFSNCCNNNNNWKINHDFLILLLNDIAAVSPQLLLQCYDKKPYYSLHRAAAGI